MTFSAGQESLDGGEGSFNVFMSIIGVVMVFVASTVYVFLEKDTKGRLISDDASLDVVDKGDRLTLVGN